MKIFAAVPVKSLDEAKSRLAPMVDDRAALAVRMLEHVLQTLWDSWTAQAIAIVSPDPRVLEIAVRHRARPLLQTHGDLNDACRQAADWALRGGAEALALVHADLPWLEAADLRALAEACPTRGVVLAPDRHGRGTNLLLARPPQAMPFQFGVDSFARHQESARALGLTCAVYESKGTSHDVDEPADLDLLRTAI
jgi:2-phospho-L-lactate guanylyltransferase